MAVNKPEEGTFHGGFVRDRGEGRGIRVSTVKVQALAPAQESVPVGLQASKDKQARKTKLAVMGLSSTILDAGDPRYAACVRLANSFRKVRSREIYDAHGYVSAGVSALLASSALALSAARYLYELAATTEDGRPGMLKTASSLSDSARQNELSAWELASREAVIKKRNDNNSVSVPWLTADNGGAEKRKPGRPRKEHLQLESKEATNARDTSTEVEPSSEGSD